LLFLLQLGNLLNFLVKLHLSMLLHKITISLIRVTSLVLGELEWVVAVGEVVSVVVVIIIDLNILGVNHIVIQNFFHLLLVGDLTKSLCQTTPLLLIHIGKLLHDIV